MGHSVCVGTGGVHGSSCVCGKGGVWVILRAGERRIGHLLQGRGERYAPSSVREGRDMGQPLQGEGETYRSSSVRGGRDIWVILCRGRGRGGDWRENFPYILTASGNSLDNTVLCSRAFSISRRPSHRPWPEHLSLVAFYLADTAISDPLEQRSAIAPGRS